MYVPPSVLVVQAYSVSTRGVIAGRTLSAAGALSAAESITRPNRRTSALQERDITRGPAEGERAENRGVVHGKTAAPRRRAARNSETIRCGGMSHRLDQ